MWPFKKNEKRKNPSAMPGWLKLAVIVFVGYALLMSGLPSTPNKPNEAHEAAQKIKTTLQQSELANLDGYKQKIFPERASQMEVKVVQEGSGSPAVCGQQVSLAYQAFLAQGTELNDRATPEKPLRFTIGDGNVMPVFDQGVIGMKQGEKRSIFAPPFMAYGLEQYRRDDIPAMTTTRFEIELLSSEPAIPSAEASPFRTSDILQGRGPLIVCGSEVRAHVSLWNIEGKKLYSSKDAEPITTTIGTSELMLGLEHGMIGMREGGIRLLVIPPSFQATLTGKTPTHNFPLPKNETVMMEVEAISR